MTIQSSLRPLHFYDTGLNGSSSTPGKPDTTEINGALPKLEQLDDNPKTSLIHSRDFGRNSFGALMLKTQTLKTQTPLRQDSTFGKWRWENGEEAPSEFPDGSKMLPAYSISDTEAERGRGYQVRVLKDSKNPDLYSVLNEEGQTVPFTAVKSASGKLVIAPIMKAAADSTRTSQSTGSRAVQLPLLANRTTLNALVKENREWRGLTNTSDDDKEDINREIRILLRTYNGSYPDAIQRMTLANQSQREAQAEAEEMEKARNDPNYQPSIDG